MTSMKPVEVFIGSFLGIALYQFVNHCLKSTWYGNFILMAALVIAYLMFEKPGAHPMPR